MQVQHHHVASGNLKILPLKMKIMTLPPHRATPRLKRKMDTKCYIKLLFLSLQAKGLYNYFLITNLFLFPCMQEKYTRFLKTICVCTRSPVCKTRTKPQTGAGTGLLFGPCSHRNAASAQSTEKSQLFFKLQPQSLINWVMS